LRKIPIKHVAPYRRVIAQLTLGLLVISLLSGLIPVFVYHPSTAYESVQKLMFLIPYGAFFRQLHYFSSELFLILLLGHVVLELGRYVMTISRSSWIYAVAGTGVVVLLMFSGFILKGDQSGSAAAQVALHLMGQTPLLDRLVPLVQDTELFYSKYFVWHAIFLPLLLVWMTWKHIGKIWARREYWIVGLGLSVLLLLFLSMPEDIAPAATVEHLRGPWFFLGAENLLQLGLNSWQVTTIVAVPFGLLLLYPFVRKPIGLTVALALWVIGYVVVSLVV